MNSKGFKPRFTITNRITAGCTRIGFCGTAIQFDGQGWGKTLISVYSSLNIQ